MLDLFGHACASERGNSNPGSGDATEVWRAVVGYEGQCEVSSLGRVRSLDVEVTHVGRWGTVRTTRTPGRMLAPVFQIFEGYTTVRVNIGSRARGNKALRTVSSLVAAAFIGPRPAGHEVAHNDGNSQNNAAENLRYATPAENTADKFKHGTVLRGEQVGNAKLDAAKVSDLKARLRSGEPGWALAKEFGVSQAQVSQIRNGKRWGHVE